MNSNGTNKNKMFRIYIEFTLYNQIFFASNSLQYKFPSRIWVGNYYKSYYYKFTFFMITCTYVITIHYHLSVLGSFTCSINLHFNDFPIYLRHYLHSNGCNQFGEMHYINFIIIRSWY